MSSNCPLHDCSFIKDSENVHWKAEGEFWSKHKFHVFVGNCLMNLILDSFWIHFGLILAHFWPSFGSENESRHSWGVPRNLLKPRGTPRNLVERPAGLCWSASGGSCRVFWAERCPKRVAKWGQKGSKGVEKEDPQQNMENVVSVQYLLCFSHVGPGQ